MTPEEYKTEPDNIAVKDLIRIFNEYFLPKRNSYHNRGEFFWTKQTETETPEVFWRRLIEIEEECAFEGNTAEDVLISEFLTANTDAKQNTYDRKNREKTISETLITSRDKEIKEEPIQKMD